MAMVRRLLERSPRFCRSELGRLIELFGWSLVALSLCASGSAADAQAQSITIAAGPLSRSIRLLSDQARVSVGFKGALPSIRTKEVRGAASPREALSQMLAGTGYRAVETGRTSFRLEPIGPKAALAPVRTVQAPTTSQADIIVTARKRSEPLSTLPATDHVIKNDQLRSAIGLPDSNAVSRELPSVTISGLGAGRNRIFVRGIGDGPLDGFNQGSVAIVVDGARFNYDAPDPDWALIDVDQIEVLEGPQGPLYGTGALGGIVKISTNRPDLDRSSAELAAGLSVTDDAGLSNSQSAVLNVPLVEKQLALRAVAYRQFEAGWIDDVGGPVNSNSERLVGGRLEARWAPDQRWTIDLSGAIQNRRSLDSQYVDGNLGSVKRPDRLREPRDLDSKLAMMTVRGLVGPLELTSITSISAQEAVADYDSTPLAPVLGTSGTTLVEDDRTYQLFDQEVRIQNRRQTGLQWLAGASLVKASTKALIVARDQRSSVALLTLRRTVTEAALFGEASLPLASSLTLGGGARIFSNAVDDEGQEGQTSRALGQRVVRGAADASLNWQPADGATIFVRASTGYRAGGINVEANATQHSYEPDELASIELGSRVRFTHELSLDATLYGESWQHVQADELLANGLVATRNAGNARNIGVEADSNWTIAPKLTLRGGVMIQSAKLESTTGPIEDPRLPAVPQAAARITLIQSFRIGRWNGEASLGLRYVGSTHMSFDPALDRRTRAHGTADFSIILSRGAWTAALVGENLTNVHSDRFGFGNPYRVRSAPQRTPTVPRTIGLRLTHSLQNLF